jgi:DNA-binding response OmpR family regulator
MRILLIDDDEIFSNLLKTHLVKQRYTIDVAKDGQEGWDFLEVYDYDLIVLDVMLPKLDGISFCRRLRAKNFQILVLLLTAKGTSDDKVMGLDAGADDYLVKPVPISELEARIRALLRRQATNLFPILEWGYLRLDPSQAEVTYDSNILNLTAKEYALLELFMRNTHKIHSQTSILNQLWSLEDEPTSGDTVRALIKRLRQKLKAVGAADLIETIYGLGYRLNPELEKLQQAPTVNWEDKSQILEQISILDQATQELLQNSLPAKSIQNARQQAHKLIGSLGILGLSEGSEIARNIEMLLQSQFLPQSQLQQQVESLKLLVETPLLQKQGIGIRNNHQEEKILQPSKTTEAKVVILDDDKLTLKLLRTILEPWGLQVTTVNNPMEIWHELETVNPDLLILDVQMPDIDGIELCQTLRNDSRWTSLPVLFLTGHRDAETIQQVFTVGADDYVNKPIVAPELIIRIFNRLERTRLLREEC